MLVRGLALVAALGSSGCAAILMDPPREDRSPLEDPQCNSSSSGVGIDGVLGTLLGITAIAVLADGGSDSGSAFIGVSALSAAYLGSAVAGTRSAERCSVAKQAYQGEILAMRADAEADVREITAAAPGAVAEAAVVAAEPAARAGEPAHQPEAEPEAEPEPEARPALEVRQAAPSGDFASEPAPTPTPTKPPTKPTTTKRPPRAWSDFWQEQP